MININLKVISTMREVLKSEIDTTIMNPDAEYTIPEIKIQKLEEDDVIGYRVSNKKD